ncbi:hypothetical protein D9M71_634540 [compost metagenome]
MLVLEEDPRAGADRGFLPGLEGLLRTGDRRIDFLLGGEGNAGEDFLSGRVDHLAPFGSGGFDELAVDQQFDGGGCGSGLRGHGTQPSANCRYGPGGRWEDSD